MSYNPTSHKATMVRWEEHKLFADFFANFFFLPTTIGKLLSKAGLLTHNRLP